MLNVPGLGTIQIFLPFLEVHVHVFLFPVKQAHKMPQKESLQYKISSKAPGEDKTLQA